MHRSTVRIALCLCLLLAGQSVYAIAVATSVAAGSGTVLMQDCEHGMPDNTGTTHLPCCMGHGFCPVMQAQLPALHVVIDAPPLATRYRVQALPQIPTRTSTPLLRPPIAFSL